MLLILQRRWVEAGDTAAIGRYPIDSAPSFEQVVNEWMGQSLCNSIGRELVAVESAQAVTSAEPEKTARVADDAQDQIARQTVGSCVGSHRKLLGRDASRAGKERQRQVGYCKKCPAKDDQRRMLFTCHSH